MTVSSELFRLRQENQELQAELAVYRTRDAVYHQQRIEAARKAAATRKRRTAARKAVKTRKRREAARKAAATRRRNAQTS